MTAVAVVFGASIPTWLPGFVNDQKIGDRLQIIMNFRAIDTSRFDRSFNIAGIPISPVDIILILGYTEGVANVLSDYRLALFRHQIITIYRRSKQIGPIQSTCCVIYRQPVCTANVGYHS